MYIIFIYIYLFGCDPAVASSFRLGLCREQMKGSVMDAMSQAVDEADAMLFCVGLAYKESGAQNILLVDCRILRLLAVWLLAHPANCRLEANCESHTAVFVYQKTSGLISMVCIRFEIPDCADAHQQEVMLVPLLMEQGYRPKGWLVRAPFCMIWFKPLPLALNFNAMSVQGLILGTRLWSLTLTQTQLLSHSS